MPQVWNIHAVSMEYQKFPKKEGESHQATTNSGLKITLGILTVSRTAIFSVRLAGLHLSSTRLPGGGGELWKCVTYRGFQGGGVATNNNLLGQWAY